MKMPAHKAQFAKANAATSSGTIAKKSLPDRVDATVKHPRVPLK